MRIDRLILSLLLVVPLALGCSDDDTNNTNNNTNNNNNTTQQDAAVADTGTTPDQSVPADRGKSFSFGIQFRNHINGAYLTGVKVCIQGTSTCVTAQGTGITSRAKVTLPTDKDSVLLITLKDYIPMALFVGKDTREPGTNMFLIPDTWETSLGTKAKVTIDKTKAILRISAFEALGGGYGNASLVLTPASGTGPMSTDTEGYPDPTKKTTGAYAMAWAWYFNVASGDYTLQVKDNDGNICDVFIGWNDSGSKTARAKIKPVAGHINVVEFRCKEQKT